MTLLIRPISIELAANGSLIFRDATGQVIELPTGSEDDVLTILDGVPTWEAGSKKTLTVAGDILYASGANTLARLGIETENEVLTIRGGVLAWEDTGNVFANNSISASSDAVDVENVGIVYVNTGDGNVVIGGLANGINNQVVRLIKVTGANTMTIENNEAGGTQKILTRSAADIVVSNWGGVTMIYNGSNWFTVGE